MISAFCPRGRQENMHMQVILRADPAPYTEKLHGLGQPGQFGKEFHKARPFALRQARPQSPLGPLPCRVCLLEFARARISQANELLAPILAGTDGDPTRVDERTKIAGEGRLVQGGNPAEIALADLSGGAANTASASIASCASRNRAVPHRKAGSLPALPGAGRYKGRAWRRLSCARSSYKMYMQAILDNQAVGRALARRTPVGHRGALRRCSHWATEAGNGPRLGRSCRCARSA